ncbi:MAG: vitamin B12 dependent-methionine synthase activation domain-containing protein [Erysipelotrichaceae bacterium]|nr:vitamin B12 dependent-methionine synthase activation domain-containing protein [Erysipelotrichaceae bacterium]MDD3810110.1 vitamin B12 dependent-methionine synthase activation domain-containing protein [Erysipelotrichaceae bacterium]
MAVIYNDEKIESGGFMDINYDLNQVKRYLGMDEQPNEIDQDIEKLYQRLKPLLDPKYYYRVFKFSLNPLKIENRIFKSKDMDKLLNTSDRVIILAVTLGGKIEQEIRRFNVANKFNSIVSDALLSSMVEDYQEKIIDQLRGEYPGKYFTDAFAPGYGDLDINFQRDIFDLLQLEKRIGVNLTPTMLMVPRKSITCFIGISDIAQGKVTGCDTCNMKETCQLRKAGKSCAR